jgi:alcohol dehydrogenase
VDDFDVARQLLKNFKGDAYLKGSGILDGVGTIAAAVGKSIFLIRDQFSGSDRFIEAVKKSLFDRDVKIAGETSGAGPNCPREDLFRIAESLKSSEADIVVTFGGGSTIDAGKAAEVLRKLDGDIEQYFGTGLVTKGLEENHKSLSPHVAIQTAASSGAHLTKYSNITDVTTGQKKLIVDEGIVPTNPVFDYEVTYATPPDLTADGALDGIAHCLEVLYGAVGTTVYPQIEKIATTGIRLVVNHLPRVIKQPRDKESREALCLATDLGGFAIMVGGTNGGHLTSFSLVDVLSHGRSCAIMNPYYTVFFAPAIPDALRTVGSIYKHAGFTTANLDALSGRDLGVAVAEAMFALAEKIGFPTRLAEVPGFSDAHIERALSAAKNPQLEMKLKNMPVPLTAEMIDEYMRPILEGARDGRLNLIKTV